MPTYNKSHTDNIQSIERAIAILNTFSEQDPELGITEISKRLKLHKSTVSRIISTLQNKGLVNQNQTTKKYRLGVGLISLAGVALGRLDVRGIAQLYMDDLVVLSQETVNLTILDGNECVSIARVGSPKPLRYVGWIGRRTPLHCTASGKIMLAFMPEQDRDNRISKPLKTYTNSTLTDRDIILEELLRVKSQYYAIVHEEFEEGFSSIAAPVFNHNAELAGALAILGPTFRIGPGIIENFIEPLEMISRKISTELGYRENTA